MKTFFLVFGDDTRKVQGGFVQSLRDVEQVAREKFRDVPAVASAEALSFKVADRQYGVKHTIQNAEDIYDGAQVEVSNGATPTPAAVLPSTSATSVPAAQTLAVALPSPASNPNRDLERDKSRYVVRLRGIPWECTVDQIITFFSLGKARVQEGGVEILMLPNGRAKGEALVEFEADQDKQTGLTRNGQNIGSRYIELFESSGEEMDRARGLLQKDPCPVDPTSFVMRCRGLPWTATREDVAEFFKRAQLKPLGIHLPTAAGGRSSGEAYIEFGLEQEARAALGLNKGMVGQRYVELFEATQGDMLNAMGSYPGGSDMKYIKMRGLPFQCSEYDITQFFQSAGAQPVRIHRNQGVAFVEFATNEDANRGMTKDRQNIGSRYIECFRVEYSEMAREVGLQPAQGLGAMGQGMEMLGQMAAGAAGGMAFPPYGAAASWALPSAQPAYGAARGLGAYGAGAAAIGAYNPYAAIARGFGY